MENGGAGVNRLPRLRKPMVTCLKDESPADLYAARLEDVCVARDDAVVNIVEVHIRQAVAPAVEQVEELEAHLEEGRLGQFRLLHNAQIFGHKGLGTQPAVGGRGVAEEQARVRVVGDVGRVNRRAVIEGDGRWVAEVARAREGRRVQDAHVHAAAGVVRVEVVAHDVRAQVAEVVDTLEKLPLPARDEGHERRPATVAMDGRDLEAADQAVNKATLVEEPPPLTKGQLEDVVEDERVRRDARRDRAQRGAVERVLKDTVERRVAEDVLGRVRNQFRMGVREPELYALRDAALKVYLAGVVDALPLTLQTVVDDSVLREGAERLRDRTREVR